MRNEGRVRVEASVNGLDFPIPFQNMRVDVPILSVRKYVRNGWDFKFTDTGGSMTCRLNGKTLDFIEADGAFWIKLKVGNPLSDAVRPNCIFAELGAAPTSMEANRFCDAYGIQISDDPDDPRRRSGLHTGRTGPG